MGTPPPAVRTLRVVPIFPQSVGCLPTFFRPTWGFGHGPIHRQPVPINPFEGLMGLQAVGPPRQEDARRRPLLEAAMDGTTGTETRRLQRVPLAPGTQHGEHGIRGVTLIDAGAMAPQRVRLPWGNSGWRRSDNSSGTHQSRWTFSWSVLIEQAPGAENFCQQDPMTHVCQMFRQRCLQGRWQHRSPVFIALTFSKQNLAAGEVHVFHSESQALR